MKHLKSLWFLPIAIITICSMYLMISTSNSKKKRALYNHEYKGVVFKKYIQTWNHALKTFDIKIYDDVELKIIAEDWGYREMKFYSWDYAEVGDSIIKPKDQLRIIIKKKDGTSKSFPYLY